MKPLLIASTIPLLASCSMWNDLVSRDATDLDLPGIQTVINCNPEPTLIYSKTGDLIDTVIPVLHPSCSGEEITRTSSRSFSGPWWTWFGPPAARAAFNPMESLDDDDPIVNPRNVAANDPNPAPRPTATAAPSDPSTPAPNAPADPSPTAPADPAPAPDEPDHSGCVDGDECHDHPDHDPATMDNAAERIAIHGLSG